MLFLLVKVIILELGVAAPCLELAVTGLLFLTAAGFLAKEAVEGLEAGAGDLLTGDWPPP